MCIKWTVPIQYKTVLLIGKRNFQKEMEVQAITGWQEGGRDVIFECFCAGRLFFTNFFYSFFCTGQYIDRGCSAQYKMPGSILCPSPALLLYSSIGTECCVQDPNFFSNG